MNAARYQHLGYDKRSNAFDCFWVKSSSFGFHWHYHPELEITYVHRGYGHRLVGDSVHPFAEGDFVFLGSNLPHTWISDDDFNRSEVQMEVIVLQINPNLFSQNWISIPELNRVKRLLTMARRGIFYHQGHHQKAVDLLLQMVHQSGFERFQSLLSLLNDLGKLQNTDLLASNAYVTPSDTNTEERILKVCQYVHDSFTQAIKLKDVANLANMNPTSFCRFFKKTTGESFMDYVNDLRIGKASNMLLTYPQMTVAEVAYQAGFNSQTLFNRIFLRKKNCTPSEFRKFGRR